ncbi:venom allergen 5-like [Penaeus indicus]|uniref:venom allergen 5-like n=1 Tax=Penaeus indicus TaxID=29960 RepID=UPI00300CF397
MSAFRRVMSSLLPVLLLVGMARQTRPCEYRSVDPRHTMCAFRPGQCSGKSLLRTGGITCKDIETIISTHNTLRQKLSMGQVRNQPPALNMRAMEWDDELAAVAQRWADQCMPGHDRSRNVPRFTVGQNVAAAWTFDRDLGDTPDFATQVEAWFNEVNQYGFPKGNVDPFRFNKATGHYTQMVWAETHLVGCGYAYYKDPSRGYTKIYVCNYAPGGNVIGGSMYKMGYPGQPYCVGDGLIPSPSYQGLCEADSAPQQRSCSKDAAAGSPSTSSFLQLPPPGPPLTNSLSSGGHPIMGPGGHHMPAHHPMMMAPHPPILGGPHGDEYLSVEHDGHDLMRPTDFLMKGIQEPIMGLMKILNPWNILNRFRG